MPVKAAMLWKNINVFVFLLFLNFKLRKILFLNLNKHKGLATSKGAVGGGVLASKEKWSTVLQKDKRRNEYQRI